jgi:GNAT superfamily N-acetyltransferase
MADTLELPFSSRELWRERLAEEREGEVSLVACAGGEVVGHISLYLYPEPRRGHSGHFGMAVRDDWQGRGVGTKLLEAALNLADNWLGHTVDAALAEEANRRFVDWRFAQDKPRYGDHRQAGAAGQGGLGGCGRDHLMGLLADHLPTSTPRREPPTTFS